MCNNNEQEMRIYYSFNIFFIINSINSVLKSIGIIFFPLMRDLREYSVNVTLCKYDINVQTRIQSFHFGIEVTLSQL